MSENIKDFLTQISDIPEYSELLHRRGFQVNMRLYKINKKYRKMIKDIIKYLHIAIKTNYGWFSASGMSGHNVGIPLNIICFYKGRCNTGDDGIITMINPKIMEQSKETKVCGSGCGSIADGKTYYNKRPLWILVKYFDIKGIEHTDRFNYTSDIICHELDHNNGIMVTDNPA